MGQSEATRQSDFIIAPVSGQISVFTTGAAASQDLRLCGLQASANDSQPNPVGLIGKFASFQADGVDVYVKFGPTAASVTTGNAPVPSAVGVNAAGGCFKIPDGAVLAAKLRPGVDLFIGYMSGSAGQLRIVQSSEK